MEKEISKFSKNKCLINKKETFFIFLDIDGVLNNFSKNTELLEFTKENVNAFNILLEKLKTKFNDNIKIILSSSWTSKFFIEDIKKIFYANNIDGSLIVDRTNHYNFELKYLPKKQVHDINQPFFKDLSEEEKFERSLDRLSGRNKEIYEFIQKMNISQFLIIDDMYLTNNYLRSNQIHTSNKVGLTIKDIEKFLPKLNIL